jgi:uncharacterized protein with FMN-binding domain
LNRSVVALVAAAALLASPELATGAELAVGPNPTPKPRPKAKKKAAKPKPKPTATTTTTGELSSAQAEAILSATKEAAAAVEISPGNVRGANVLFTYGKFQVTVAYKATTLTDCEASYETDKPRSHDIMDNAIPTLCKEALEAGTANVHTVSGATKTSNAFIASLQSALVRAGLSTLGAVSHGHY